MGKADAAAQTKGVRDYMAEKGIKEGEGVRFATMEDLVKAAGIFATDENVDGEFAFALVDVDRAGQN